LRSVILGREYNVGLCNNGDIDISVGFDCIRYFIAYPGLVAKVISTEASIMEASQYLYKFNNVKLIDNLLKISLFDYYKKTKDERLSMVKDIKTTIVRHSCGHNEFITLYNGNDMSDRQLKSLEKKPCPKCEGKRCKH
jgi:hypothetical protein